MSDIEDDNSAEIISEDDISEDLDDYVDPENEDYSDYESDEDIFKEEEETPLKDDIKIIYRVPDDERITTNILSLFEMTKIVGLRAQQIANGNTDNPVIFVDAEDIINSASIEKEKEMAEKEILEKRCPYKIRRTYQQGNITYFEEFDVNEMIIIHLQK